MQLGGCDQERERHHPQSGDGTECQQNGQRSRRRVAIGELAAVGIAEGDSRKKDADYGCPRLQARPNERREEPPGDDLQHEHRGIREEDD